MKILLIRLRSIGDIVQCTPAFAAARKLFAGSSIDLLVEERHAELVVENHCIDGLILYRNHGRGFFEKIKYDLGFAMMLRKRHYDLVIDFHGIPKTAWFSYFSGSPVRVGYDYPGRGHLYTHRMKPPKKFTTHSAQNQINLLGSVPEELCAQFPLKEICAGSAQDARPADGASEDKGAQLSLKASSAASRDTVSGFGLETHISADFASGECREFLQKKGIGDRDRIFVYHISPSNDFKRWPCEKYSALINMIERHPAFSGDKIAHVIAGTESDRGEYASIASRVITVKGSMHSACGEISLGALFNLCRQAACYTGPDSGPLHIAAAAGCPVIGIFGPTNVETFAPPSHLFRGVFDETLKCRPCDQKRCQSGDFRCIRGIKPPKVLDAILDSVIKRKK